MEVKTIITPPRPNRIRNTAIYCRVSTSAFDQIRSLNSQMEDLMDYVCSRPDLKFYDAYVDVFLGNGKYERRNMNRLIKDVVDGKVQYVVTKSISRFSRDTLFLLSVIRRLKEYGVEVYFQMENIRSLSQDAELYLFLYGGVAQAESDDKSQIIKWGIDKAKSNPDSGINNKKFYGYEHGPDGKLVINEEQAAVVRKIFDWYNNGESVLRIIQHLSDEKIPSPRGREKWSKKTIENILDNDAYTGIEISFMNGRLIWIGNKRYEGIISIDTFISAMKKKIERSKIELDENGNQVRKKKRYQSPKKVNN